MERKRVYKGVPDAVYDAAFGAPSKVISEDVRLQAISEVLATAMRSTSPEHVTEKQQMSEVTEVFSVTVIGQAKPTGASLDWWSSENGVPKALQRAGAWGSVGASMVCSYPSDLLVCDRTAVLPPGRCRRTGDTWLPVELKSLSWLGQSEQTGQRGHSPVEAMCAHARVVQWRTWLVRLPSRECAVVESRPGWNNVAGKQGWSTASRAVRSSLVPNCRRSLSGFADDHFSRDGEDPPSRDGDVCRLWSS